MTLYYLINVIATFMILVYNYTQFKKKKLILGDVSCSAIKYFASKPQRGVYKLLATVGFWTFLEIFIISFVQYYLGGFFNRPFGDLFDTGANYFGMLFFAPMLVVIACMLLKIDILAQLDLITPAYPLALFFSKIACLPAGCCRGIEWEYGFYNPMSKLVEFPAQLLEAGVALLLFVFLLISKGKFKKGTVFPVYLIAFSGIRFFTEFLRCEPNVFLGLKTYHFLCIAGVLVGILEYVAARKYDTHIQSKAKKEV